jgi:hypothetical protein
VDGVRFENRSGVTQGSVYFSETGFGLYAASHANGAQFRSNVTTHTYGTWRIHGHRNGWGGIVWSDTLRAWTLMGQQGGAGFGLYDQANSSWTWYADASSLYSYKPLRVEDANHVQFGGRGAMRAHGSTHMIQMYDGAWRGPMLYHSYSGYSGGSVTVSTSAPSGGVDGDIWLMV